MRHLIIINFLLSLVLVVGCNTKPTLPSSQALPEEEKHEEHTLLRDNLAHKEIIILDEPYRAPNDFGQTFDFFYRSYLTLQNALVESDTISANKAAEGMIFMLDLVSEPSWNKEASDAWKNHREGYMKTLTEFLHVKDIQKKRSYFSHISEILYCTLKSFDIAIEEVNVVFCPMAFDNKGAYWLSDSKEIRNPYFGNKMLKCGSINETIL